ncbi:MAG: DEAD/DEAH box helicase [Salinivirgaceae bacterium]|nr:DEAD/DEAH box helicase [Salinivirgaceae bacterium]
MSFTSLGLSPTLVKALTIEKFTEPYPIQEQAIPAILNQKDILGIAPTGSGKTASYVLPILMNLPLVSVAKNRRIRALVLVPTRELAVQVNEVFKQFGATLPQPVKSMAAHGGVSINPQMKALNGVNILIATPGRLLELAENNAVEFSRISTFVLDEADKMLNMGFKDEMNSILKLLPKKRQNLLFSATLSPDIDSLNQLLLNDPQLIKIEPKVLDIELINQTAYSVTDERKGPFLRYLIKHHNIQQVLVFVSSIKRADNVANKLRANGIQAWPIHSKKSQGARTDLLTKFKHGKLQALVTTDLLSRGIDIEFLPYIVNYELPRSPKDYIHRIGRTGRAENPGEAISLITLEDEQHFNVIQKKTGKQLELNETKDIDLQGY